MRKFACVMGLAMGLLLCVGVNASAQDSDKIDIFGGYSYLRFAPNVTNISDINYNGGIGSISYNPWSWLGVVGEFSGYHAGTINYANGTATGSTSNAVGYLFGPKIQMPHGKFTPFAQVLFGGVHGSVTYPAASETPSATYSTNAFAMSLGGGLDYNFTPHLGVRLGQIDYLLSKYSNSAANSIGYNGTGTQNSFRYSAGVVVRF